jgi:hypothetical protein
MDAGIPRQHVTGNANGKRTAGLHGTGISLAAHAHSDGSADRDPGIDRTADGDRVAAGGLRTVDGGDWIDHHHDCTGRIDRIGFGQPWPWRRYRRHR